MDKTLLLDTIDKLHCALELRRKPVGTTFLFDQEGFERANANALTTRMPYCVMVKRASLGNSIKAVLKDFGCLASARALGIVEPDDFFMSGRHYNRLGLYRDLSVSKSVRRNMTLCQHRAHGVMVKPLAEHHTEPDVVLLICTPYQAMRIVQGYTYQFGYYDGFKMCGNQAICSECTAYPFETNNINISMMCAGTRFMAGWREDELAVGLPFNRFLPLVQGLWETLNPTEPDRNKKQIQSRLEKSEVNSLDIEFGKNYYSGLYRTQKEKVVPR
ncbi:DUF169 domain-containing protein [Desulfofustis glycolicus]|uniref:Uncharacterized conserved protein, DUF169 family n=1 Tax=Desulfofustis glycolicus DSM 9705 TaxID=1121409 RepID=A0A1M5WPD1_9BACT|nr:DUF169 domain-containing protein [Desulfofustis glycolicus]MCB2218731.1 DUF169 domain-containing protein [Desulfobulbaceae bacterium]SHH89361.1 Uncharacterized conserved protein, DUF169 family [Desulfofustis glycolicus DSM 9705]